MTRPSPEEKIMKPYLQKLLQEHRALNCLIDTAKAIGDSQKAKAMQQTLLQLKDKIAALRRHYYGRSLVS